MSIFRKITRYIVGLLVVTAFVGGCRVRESALLGLPCDQTADCYYTDTLTCNTLSRTCTPRLQKGEAGCGGPTDCSDGLSCNEATNTCILPGTQQLGDACITSADCDVGLRCGRRDQRAAPPAHLAAGVCMRDLDQLCESDEECYVGLRCLTPRGNNSDKPIPDGMCTPPATHAGASCSEDRECALPMICSQAHCARPSGQSCRLDEECVAGTVCAPCDSGALCCRRRSELGGGECRKNSDCAPPLFCEDKLCRVPNGGACSDDRDCGQGTTCLPSSSGQLRCGPPAPAGAECNSAPDCAKGLCSSRRRCPSELSGLCVDESDCVPGLVCAPRGALRICTNPGQACQPCDDVRDCAGLARCKGVCEAAVGMGCTNDACCSDGNYCISVGGAAALCRAPSSRVLDPCTSNAQCAGGLVCSGSLCRHPPGSGPCTATRECADLAVCLGRVCVMPGDVGAVCGLPDGSFVPEACDLTKGLLCGAEGRCIYPHTVKPGNACRPELTGLDCVPPTMCLGGICK